MLPEKLKIVKFTTEVTEESNTMDSTDRETYGCAKIERRETNSWMTICVTPAMLQCSDAEQMSRSPCFGITKDKWIEYASENWPGWDVACVWNKS